MNLYTFQDRHDEYPALRVLARDLREAIYILGTSKTAKEVNPIINAAQLLVHEKITNYGFSDSISNAYVTDATMPGIVSLSDDVFDRNQEITTEEIEEAAGKVSSRQKKQDITERREEILLQPGGSRYRALASSKEWHNLGEKTKKELFDLAKELNLGATMKNTKEEIIRILDEYFGNI